MKYRPFITLSIAIALALGGCLFGPDRRQGLPTSEMYAELRLGDADKVQLLICGDKWKGLITPDGPGGYKHATYFWFFLQGEGPVYTNPTLHPNYPPFPRYVGTITVDRQQKHIIINLQMVVSPPGGVLDTRPSPANGTYSLRSITHEPFVAPDSEVKEAPRL